MAKRATCPICNRDVALKKDGTLIKHGRHREGNSPAGPLLGKQCPAVLPQPLEQKTPA